MTNTGKEREVMWLCVLERLIDEQTERETDRENMFQTFPSFCNLTKHERKKIKDGVENGSRAEIFFGIGSNGRNSIGPSRRPKR